MGTNFYARVDSCEHCHRTDREIHIGKSSAGWTFTFHATFDIKSYKQWLEYLSLDNIKIYDEYGKNWTLVAFKELVKNKKDEKFNHAIECKDYEYDHSSLDPQGHSFSEGEFS